MGNDCLSKTTSADHPVSSNNLGGKYNVAVICGSLRKKSTNRGLLNAIVAQKHQAFNFNWVNIDNFPVFDEDIEAKGVPADVRAARKIVHQADAVLFAVPEYNFAIAAPLKNAYDWLSREYPQSNDPYDKTSPVAEKLGAIVSVAAATGGATAQEHFLHSVSYRKMNILPPTGAGQIRISRFNGTFFNENGELVNEETRSKLTPFLNAFTDFIAKNKVVKVV